MSKGQLLRKSEDIIGNVVGRFYRHQVEHLHIVEGMFSELCG